MTVQKWRPGREELVQILVALIGTGLSTIGLPLAPVLLGAFLILMGPRLKDPDRRRLNNESALETEYNSAWIHQFSLKFSDVIPNLHLFNEQILRLQEALPHDEEVTSSDIASVLEVAMKVSLNTSGKKRKLLATAVTNSFDPVLYKEGETIRLLKLMNVLTYGDIHLLRQAAESEHLLVFKDMPHVGTMALHHVKNLAEQHLIYLLNATERHKLSRGEPLDQNLNVRVTPLGSMLLKLTDEQATD